MGNVYDYALIKDGQKMAIFLLTYIHHSGIVVISNKRMVFLMELEFVPIKHNVNRIFESILGIEKSEESYDASVLLERVTKEKGRKNRYDTFYLSQEEWKLIGEFRGWIK